MSRRLGTQSPRTMSGTHVARGDAGRGYEFSGRTRESDGKDTGMYILINIEYGSCRSRLLDAGANVCLTLEL